MILPPIIPVRPRPGNNPLPGLYELVLLSPAHANVPEAPQPAVPPPGGGDFGLDASRGQEPSYQPTIDHLSQDAELDGNATPCRTDNILVQARDNPELQSEGESEGEVTGEGSEPSGSGLSFEIHDHSYWKKDDGSTSPRMLSGSSQYFLIPCKLTVKHVPIHKYVKKSFLQHFSS